MNLSEIGVFKDRIISKLINDKNIVDVLLDHPDEDLDEAEIEAELLGESGTGKEGCVFKYEYVPDIQEQTKTFLCIEIVPVTTSGSTVTELYVYVFVYCSKSIMQTYHRDGCAGTRVDILISDIDKILNGNTEFGIGPLQWESGSIYKPNNPYYGRMSIYSVSVFRKERR